MKAMRRLLATLLAGSALLMLLGSAQPQPYEPPSADQLGCCRTCQKGKACGDSCISREKECHKPLGCACDG